MEALNSLAPLVLVLRGSILGAAAFTSAPGPFPHHRVPAQIKILKADVRVEIVKSIAMRPRELIPNQNGEVSVDGYRLLVRKRPKAEHAFPGQHDAFLLIVDFP